MTLEFKLRINILFNFACLWIMCGMSYPGTCFFSPLSMLVSIIHIDMWLWFMWSRCCVVFQHIFLLPLCAPSWIMLQIHCLVHQFSLQFFTLSIGFVVSMTIFNFLKFYLVLYQIHLTFCVLTESGLRVENSIYNPQLCTLWLLLTYSNLRHGMDNNTLL